MWTHGAGGSKTRFFVDVINGWPLKAIDQSSPSPSYISTNSVWIIVDLARRLSSRHLRINLTPGVDFEPPISASIFQHADPWTIGRPADSDGHEIFHLCCVVSFQTVR